MPEVQPWSHPDEGRSGGRFGPRSHLFRGRRPPDARRIYREYRSLDRRGTSAGQVAGSGRVEPCECYICNIVKCRRPEQPSAQLSEVTACSLYLYAQLAVCGARRLMSPRQYCVAFLLWRANIHRAGAWHDSAQR